MGRFANHVAVLIDCVDLPNPALVVDPTSLCVGVSSRSTETEGEAATLSGSQTLPLRIETQARDEDT